MRVLLYEHLQACAARRPEQPAVVTAELRLSYAELWERASRCAQVLGDAGLQRGERVVLLMENSADCAAALLGCWIADAVPVPVHAQTKSDKLRWILQNCAASALITDTSLLGAAASAAEAVALRCFLAAGEAAELPAAAMAFEEALAAAPITLPPGRNIGSDLAAILYTSGTTGSPKGVMHTHASLGFTSDSVVSYLRLSADDRLFSTLPLSFGYGMFQLLPALQVGATLVLERNFTYPAQAFRRMQDEAVTTFAGVPTVYAMLLAHDAKQTLRFPSVRLVTNAAAALPPSFVPGIRRLFPNADVVPMYGQTECIRACYLPAGLVDRHPGSVGIAIPGTEALVLDDAGQPVAAGEAGTLHVRGPNVMRGYWRDPVRSAQALVPGPVAGEVMLRTGDRFRRDADGLLYFVARQDEIIKTRGEKVSPFEVEQAIYRLPDVAEALVFAVPDPILGEAVAAFVVPRSGAALTEREVKQICGRYLEAFAVPKHLRLVTELPRTPNGKLSRVLAAAQFHAEATPPASADALTGSPMPGVHA